ncbi:MAG: hypothetical protein M3N24_06165 [Actinomycetota bacterium]|nr:hypothetical protein [Actinomycetota bacterium]
MRNAVRVSIALMTGALVAFSASPAAAHETRRVGDYEFVVGWYDEPAFAYQKNGPEVTITDRNGDPVVDGVDLQVEIGFQGETMTAELEPAFVVGVFGEPGNYTADIYPTRAGTWTFRMFGTVEGLEVNETFTSGPDTFGDIEDPGEVAFPVEDPSNAELTDLVERARAQSAEDAAAARTFGYVGVGLGAVALIVAIIALVRRRPA